MSSADEDFNLLYQSKPFPSYNIVLWVDVLYDVPIKAVRNLHKNLEYEYIHEGGLNDYVHMRRKPISQPFTFEIERYVTNAGTDPLALGTEFLVPLLLFVNKWQTGGGFSDIHPGKIFIFTGAKVTGRRYGDFDSERIGFATEILTISYNNMYAISNLAGIKD